MNTFKLYNELNNVFSFYSFCSIGNNSLGNDSRQITASDVDRLSIYSISVTLFLAPSLIKGQ